MKDLAIYDAACRAIAKAVAVDELMVIRDQQRLAAAAGKIAGDRQMEAAAVTLRLRAERRIGTLMQNQREAGFLKSGRPKINGELNSPLIPPPTLAEVGINKTLAKQANKLAAMDDATFRAVLVKAQSAATKVAAKVVNDETKKQRRDSRELAVAKSLPDGICGIGVEDFEWDQKTWSDAGRGKHASNTYETATDAHTAEEIVARTEERMRCMALDHALLFMFVTIPHLAIGIDVLRLRGYRYASNIVWGKENHYGTGHWVREVHEQLLIGVRGSKIPAPLKGTQLDSLVMAPKPNAAHSSKPDVFYDWIQQTYPNITKVEFNRRGPPRPGWLAHGNEVEAANSIAANSIDHFAVVEDDQLGPA